MTGSESGDNQALEGEVGIPDGVLVACSNCGRKFLEERIETHVKICTSAKHREVYDIAQRRVVGTEAEELLKAGKLKLDPPKPLEKKSVLQAKMNELNKAVLPPIKPSAKAKERKPSAAAAPSAGMAYSVTFDGNNQLKTKKNSKFKAPLHMNAPPQRGDKK